LLVKDKPVIVGFSGGSDSVCLLYILNKLGYNCIAAHCNFHLRGEESDKDEKFSYSFANFLKVKFIKTDFNTVNYSEKMNISIEMAARELRYNWFEEERNKHDAQAIAIAHHKDDSVETLFINLIRGTGIRGLTGIKPKNNYIVRPLLSVGRVDIIDYLKKNNLSYVTDSTNSSDQYTRNFIRLKIIPLMEQLNPSFKNSALRTIENLSDVEYIYINTVEKLKNSLIHRKIDHIYIKIDDLMNQTSARSVLFELLRTYGFSRIVSQDIFESLKGDSGKIFLSSNAEYKALKDRKNLFVYPNRETETDEYTIHDNSEDWKNLPVDLLPVKQEINNNFEINKSPGYAYLDYDKLKFPLTLRRWRNGDWFIPYGMNGRKKISDFFSNEKYSLFDKESAWILCSGNDIIWVVGKRIDNRYCINKDSKTAFIVNLIKNSC
jgi:tRNA(Ile)-lysidine synthase